MGWPLRGERGTKIIIPQNNKEEKIQNTHRQKRGC
jgi:hypothetical protein